MTRTPDAGAPGFKPSMKEALYQAIHLRRDIRGQFRPDPIPEEVLARVLLAAHHAPSVGFSQPWDFLLIRDAEVRSAIHAAFERANREAALLFPDGKREQYLAFKLEGILDAPLNVCVTCDRNRFGPVVIGRTANPMMDLFSCVCAVQNLWLAACAEGLGVGWVSIIHDADLQEILGLPAHTVPVAYLCMGYVSHFPEKPELETAGWLPRLPLADLVSCDRWSINCQTAWPKLHDAIQREQHHHDAPVA